MAYLLGQERTRRERLLWALYSRVYDLLWDAPLTSAVARQVALQITPGSSLLEVGAGTGLCSRELLAIAGSLEAAEPDERMALRFSDRVPGVAPLPMSIEEIGESQYDHVVAVNVVHLTNDPATAVTHLRAACRPDGTVVVATPHASPGLVRVAIAHRRAGAGMWFCARFVGIHVALAPFIMLAARHRPTVALGEPVDVVYGVTAIHAIHAIHPINR